MPTDYQRKYFECIKVYHQLHGVISGLTMKLTGRVGDLKIPAHYKASINEVAYEGADKIKEVDLKFRDLVRTDWRPPETCVELTQEEMFL
ncbi:hypothetical protein KKB18_02105 [bacterium]|nr:hypothetical protein [bacterium]